LSLKDGLTTHSTRAAIEWPSSSIIAFEVAAFAPPR
jgi:hypothetical protein